MLILFAKLRISFLPKPWVSKSTLKLSIESQHYWPVITKISQNQFKLSCSQSTPFYAHDFKQFNQTLFLLCRVRATIVSCEGNLMKLQGIMANYVKKIALCESTSNWRLSYNFRPFVVNLYSSSNDTQDRDNILIEGSSSGWADSIMDLHTTGPGLKTR